MLSAPSPRLEPEAALDSRTRPRVLFHEYQTNEPFTATNHMDAHQEAYREETRELLSELETSLLELEEKPDDGELVGGIFRAMHTIKGSASMFGFDNIAAFTHQMETVFDLVRDGLLPISKPLVNHALAAGDQIRLMVDGEKIDARETDNIVEFFRGLAPGEAGSAPGESPVSKEAGEETTTYRIRIQPEPGILKSGANPMLLLNELRELGPCHVIARTGAIPPLKEIDPEACLLCWDVILTTSTGEEAVRDVFIFVEDAVDIRIDRIDEGDIDGPEENKRIGRILLERGELSESELREALQSQRRVGEVLVRSGMLAPDAMDSALAEQEHVNRMRELRRGRRDAASIRVAAEKLDLLVDLVGELVTIQARLSQKASIQDDADMITISEEVERLTGELRDNTMNIRMLPIGTIFIKFKRLVRDLSAELNKEADLVLKGGDTELDKTVIERLNDPLVHIIRNSIDHGIESPGARASAGKPKRGKVTLAAEHSGAEVLIRISDDGAGLDAGKIRARALDRGLIAPNEEMPESEMHALIFTPGFSTAGEITRVSGRGVGMDVVKRAVEALRGSIDIRGRKGEGAVITLRLPLTLAIIDGLLVSVGDDHYVLPLSTVEECVELKRGKAGEEERRIIKVRGEMVPYILLRELFGVDDPPPAIEEIVIAAVNDQRIGFVVDHVIGRHQTVIKNLGKVYKNAREFSGATIMADGNVALLIDLSRLTETAEEEERKR